MAINQDKKNRIEEVVKKILATRIKTFPTLDSRNRNAPFHELIVSAFQEQFKHINVPIPYLVALSSWMHGLSTSLGSGFESLAHILSGGYKREFTREFTMRIKQSQAQNIDTIIRELKTGRKKGGKDPDLDRENRLIFNFSRDEEEVNALGFTVDNYREAENLIEGIELKSVRPNSGEGRGEKQKILHAKAAFKKMCPDKKILFYIGFPFDPTATKPFDYDKERFFNYLVEFKKYFSPDEVLIAAELWDHLSGHKNTMEEIIETMTKVIEKAVKNSA